MPLDAAGVAEFDPSELKPVTGSQDFDPSDLKPVVASPPFPAPRVPLPVGSEKTGLPPIPGIPIPSGLAPERPVRPDASISGTRRPTPQTEITTPLAAAKYFGQGALEVARQPAPILPMAQDVGLLAKEPASISQEMGTSVAKAVGGLMSPESIAVMTGAELGGAGLELGANSAKIVKLLENVPHPEVVLKAVAQAAKNAIPVSFIANQLKASYDSAKQGEVGDAVVNALFAVAGLAGLKGSVERTSAQFPPEATPEAVAKAQALGGIATPEVTPAHAQAAATELEAGGQRLAAQAWRNLDRSQNIPLSVGGQDLFLKPPVMVKGRAYHEIVDSSGKTVVGGTPEIVRGWLNQNQATVPANLAVSGEMGTTLPTKGPEVTVSQRVGSVEQSVREFDPGDLKPVENPSYELATGTVRVTKTEGPHTYFIKTLPDGTALKEQRILSKAFDRIVEGAPPAQEKSVNGQTVAPAEQAPASPEAEREVIQPKPTEAKPGEAGEAVKNPAGVKKQVPTSASDENVTIYQEDGKPLATVSKADLEKLQAKQNPPVPAPDEPVADKSTTLFESKLLLKNQQAGMIAWAKGVMGPKDPKVRQTIIDKIEKMKKALTPQTEESFLSDLVAQKLGMDVSYEEAQKIAELADKVKNTKEDMESSPRRETSLPESYVQKQNAKMREDAKSPKKESPNVELPASQPVRVDSGAGKVLPLQEGVGAGVPAGDAKPVLPAVQETNGDQTGEQKAPVGKGGFEGTLFRGTEAGTAGRELRESPLGELGRGAYVTPHRWLAATYGGGPTANVKAGTREVHQVDLTKNLEPKEVAYLDGGSNGQTDAVLTSGDGKELWKGRLSGKKDDRERTNQMNLAARKAGAKIIIGGKDSVALNQVVVLDRTAVKTPKKLSAEEALRKEPKLAHEKVAGLQYSPHSHVLVAWDSAGEDIIREHVMPEGLDDYIGADVAKDLLAQPTEKGEGVFGDGYHILKGENLTKPRLKLVEKSVNGFSTSPKDAFKMKGPELAKLAKAGDKGAQTEIDRRAEKNGTKAPKVETKPAPAETVVPKGETKAPVVETKAPVREAPPKAVPGKAIAEMLRKGADSLQTQIDAKRNSGIFNQNPTRRRNEMAEGIKKDADRLERIQKGLRTLADLHESGQVPVIISGVKSRSAFESLLPSYHEHGPERGTRREARFPSAYISSYPAKEIIEKIQGTKGNAEGKFIVLKAQRDGARITEKEIPFVEAAVDAAEKKGFNGKSLRESIATAKRLYNIGINEGNYKSAVDAVEALGVKKREPTAEEKIAKAERDLAIGSKIEGFFPTPKPLAKEMVQKADIRQGMTVLEPSAGNGNIADAIREEGTEPDVIEPYSTLRGILEQKKHKLIGSDFLEEKGKYDRIVMNPPFERRQDVDHVRHAYELLKPGGRVVAIMSEGTFFGSDKKAAGFREWLDEHNGAEEKLPEGSFTGKDAMRQTGVAARMVVIDKQVEKVSKQEKLSPDGKTLSQLNESLAQNGYGKPYSQLSEGQKESIDLRAARRMAPLPTPEKKPVTPQIVPAKKRPEVEPTGSSAEVYTTAGRKINVKYNVREASDLTNSFESGYPQEYQPRDTARKGSRVRVDQRKADMSGPLMADSRLASDGAPITLKDGTVITRNHGSQALKELYAEKNPQADKYREWVAEHAKEFGLDRAKVEAMKQPVLIRAITDKMDQWQVSEFAKEANASSTARMSDSEVASALAERMTGSLMDSFDPGEDGRPNPEFVRELIKTLPVEEQAVFMDKDGKLSQTGARIIRQVIFAKAYPDERALERMAESESPTLKNLTAGMLAAAPRVAKLQEEVSRGNRFDLGIGPEIADAAAVIDGLVRTGKTLDVWMNQSDMFGRNPVVERLVQVLSENRRSSKRIGDFIREYTDVAEAAGSPKQESMFGPPEAPEKIDVAEAAYQRAKDRWQPQRDIFEAQGTKPEGSGLAPKEGQGAGPSEEPTRFSRELEPPQDSLFGDNEESESAKESQRYEDRLLGQRLTAQIKSGLAKGPSKLKAAKNKSLFEENGPDQNVLFSRGKEPEGSGRIGTNFRNGILWVNSAGMKKLGEVFGSDAANGMYIPSGRASGLISKVPTELRPGITAALKAGPSITVVRMNPGESISQSKAKARHELFHATETWGGEGRAADLLEHPLAQRASALLAGGGYDAANQALMFSEIGAHLVSGPAGWEAMGLDREEAKELFRRYLELLDDKTVAGLNRLAPQLKQELYAERSIRAEQADVGPEGGPDDAEPEGSTEEEPAGLRQGVRQGIPEEGTRPTGTGKVKESKLAKGVEEKAIRNGLTDGFSGRPEYRTVNIAEQAQLAARLIENDPAHAIEIAMGREMPPAGLLPESVFVAVENYATGNKDVNLLRDLATASTLSMEATGMGQRIRMLGERNPDSPVSAMQSVVDAREKAAKKRYGPKAKEKIKAEIKATIKKASPKKGAWENFIEEIACK